MPRGLALAVATTAAVVLVAVLTIGLLPERVSTPSPTAPPTSTSSPRPTATPGVTASTAARRYTSPIGYFVALTAPWRRSDLQSRLEPDPRGDPDLLAVERFTSLSPADERDAIARTHVGLGPAFFYTAWVSLYRNSRGLSAMAYAEREQGAYGLNVVSVTSATLDGRAGARTTWRLTTSDPRTFYAYYVPDGDRMWVVGHFLGPSAERPAGATDEAVRAIVESFRFGG